MLGLSTRFGAAVGEILNEVPQVLILGRVIALEGEGAFLWAKHHRHSVSLIVGLDHYFGINGDFWALNWADGFAAFVQSVLQ
ncbi:hypothetical protein D3C81_1982260 [compost metagenome]